MGDGAILPRFFVPDCGGNARPNGVNRPAPELRAREGTRPAQGKFSTAARRWKLFSLRWQGFET